jgi:asparagine synthase (glutamine-hydrolysing)
MCGIVGAIDRGTRDATGALRDMMQRVAHRGPDDAGVACWPESGAGLGHQRLSILDLTAAGHQPMSGGDGLVSITYNGEIYNFRDLRGELQALGHSFRSTSDTEVLLRAYEQWGADCVPRLRGMFAFAVWDARAGRLLLARDRLGIKPLYYFHKGPLLAFASEPKALLAHPAVSARLDPASAADYLTYGYVPFDRCIFDGIRKLPPGHLLYFERGQLRVQEYWQFAPGADRDMAAPSEPALRDALADAVRVHLESDVPVGAFLSGGLDSSVVTALMARASSTPVHTLSVGFDWGASELPWARDVAARYGTSHHEEHVRVEGVAELIRTLARTYDEPLADPSTVPTYLLCAAARQQVKVALSGDGGDELFAGYGWYGRMLKPPVNLPGMTAVINGLRSVPRFARTQVLLRQGETDVLRRYQLHVGLFDEWERRRVAGPLLQPLAREADDLWLFRRFFRRDLPLLTALQWLDLKTFLVDDILVKVDRASMAHSLEVRPALLDHHVVERAFRIPAAAQRDGDGGKAFFKRATADLLPDAVLNRSKRGFSPPTTRWFKAALWPVARERIQSGFCVREGLIDKRFVEWMVANYTERRWSKVWSLWFLEEWYRAWIAR